MKTNVLVVDDELLIRKSLAKVLRSKGYAVELASTAGEGLEKAAELKPQVMILDMRLPDGDGLSVLRQARELDPLLQVILITAFGDHQKAFEAAKLGAVNFLPKPYELQDIELAVEAASNASRQATHLDLYRRKDLQNHAANAIIGTSDPILEVRGLIDKLVRSKATSVLITGESGTGKELVARAIHYGSDRAEFPLMEVNCSSFNESLLENELFGHEKGAYTDAGDTKKGLVELCDGGTLFLDEVADMSLPTQARLLRFIEHRSFKRVGGAQDIAVDIRIVAATNKDLEQEVRSARFRSDLYFRLKVVSIHLPPLRERGDDIVRLASHFLDEFSRRFQKRFVTISPEAELLLRNYRWPGNVRELRNVLERAVLLEDGGVLEPDHLPAELYTRGVEDAGNATNPSSLAYIEAEHILKVLKLTSYNKTQTARILGISRQGLIEKLRRLGIESGAGRQVS
jgi:two-component system response regulator AtoC